MKTLIGLLIFTFSFCANAELVPMPECKVNGKDVIYQKLTIPNGVPYVADARIENGEYIIGFNDALLSKSPKEWQNQALLHECGHFKTLINKSHSYNGKTKEYAADCYSAEVLKSRYNYGPNEFNIIIGAMLTVHLPWDRAINFERCALTK